MDPKALQSVCKVVYIQFPQVAGSKPEVKLQSATSGGKSKDQERYLLVFSNKGNKSARVPVTTYVRVTADGHGKILKISSSK